MTINAIRLAPQDNVAVLLRDAPAGGEVSVEELRFPIASGIGLGHKVAVRPIARGEKIVKHAMPIGSAIADIPAGAHVHVHNMRSDYLPTAMRTEGPENGGGR
jgi:hypothetical protein